MTDRIGSMQFDSVALSPDRQLEAVDRALGIMIDNEERLNAWETDFLHDMLVRQKQAEKVRGSPYSAKQITTALKIATKFIE